jgi:orotate phosphoribosyltransferase
VTPTLAGGPGGSTGGPAPGPGPGPAGDPGPRQRVGGDGRPLVTAASGPPADGVPVEPPLPAGRLDQDAVLELYRRTGALRTGHFVLSSGGHSDTYLQSALVLQWPRAAEALGWALAEPYQGRVDAVVGPAMGGVVIGHEAARALGVRMLFTERVRGGAVALRRSFRVAAGERVLITEDVVTTGGSALEVCDLLEAAGAEVVALATIIDRLPGSVQLPVPFTALARVAAGAWEAAACPACQAGLAAESPGSRRLDGHGQ